MSTQKTWSRFLLLPVLLLAVVLTSGSVRAVEPYDVTVSSPSFEPGAPVDIIVSGFVNQTISIRITDKNGDIVAGRDTQLNETGQYIYNWVPSQQGTYNVTVTYSTGIIITKSFLVQEKVTDQDIAQLYLTIFGIRDRLVTLIDDLRGLVQVSLLLAVISIVTSVGVVWYLRKNVSHMETDFERWLKTDVEGVLKKLIEDKTPK